MTKRTSWFQFAFVCFSKTNVEYDCHMIEYEVPTELANATLKKITKRDNKLHNLSNSIRRQVNSENKNKQIRYFRSCRS